MTTNQIKPEMVKKQHKSASVAQWKVNTLYARFKWSWVRFPPVIGYLTLSSASINRLFLTMHYGIFFLKKLSSAAKGKASIEKPSACIIF